MTGKTKEKLTMLLKMSVCFTCTAKKLWKYSCIQLAYSIIMSNLYAFLAKVDLGGSADWGANGS